MKLLELPLRKPTRKLVVGVSLNQQRHEYVNAFDGLRLVPGGPILPRGQRLAVPRKDFDEPWMKDLLERDGLGDIKNFRIGARIVIENRPGIFVGVVDTWPDNVERPILEIGGSKQVKVDEQIVFQQRNTIELLRN